MEAEGYDDPSPVAPQQLKQGYEGLPLDYYSPMYMGGMGMDNRVGLAKELDPQNALIDAVFTLRGKLKNPTTNRYDIEFQRVMNELGIAVFITQVKGAANSINTYSNYRTDDKLIYKLMNKWIMDIVYIFYYERKKFVYQENEKTGNLEPTLIQDEAVVSLVINLAVGLMLPSFFKALGAGDRGAVTKTISEMIQRAFRDNEPDNLGQPRRKGLMSRLNPFAK